MRAIFLGTPEAAVPSLHALAGIADVALVLTRPDRPRGRSARPQPSEVSRAAADLGLGVTHPETADELEAAVASVGPFDVALVVAYGMLIRPRVLAMPAAGFVNVHFSLLPRWRGAAPVQRALLAGDAVTGVTLMQMDEGLDTGPMLATTATRVGSHEDAASLTSRLADLGSHLVARWLPAAVEGRIARVAQDPARATTAPKLRTEERWIDVHAPAATVLASVRGLSPWPGAWIRHPTGAVRIHRAEAGVTTLAPGALGFAGGSVELGTGDGSVRLVTVQPEGKRAMAAGDWARGLRDRLDGES